MQLRRLLLLDLLLKGRINEKRLSVITLWCDLLYKNGAAFRLIQLACRLLDTIPRRVEADSVAMPAYSESKRPLIPGSTTSQDWLSISCRLNTIVAVPLDNGDAVQLEKRFSRCYCSTFYAKPCWAFGSGCGRSSCIWICHCIIMYPYKVVNLGVASDQGILRILGRILMGSFLY